MLCSPFSQKNIQECRCGTESCRGVLGPKPKKPVEERSIASALIAGTKRKLQHFLGSARARSESATESPKKRRVLTGSLKSRTHETTMKAVREQAELDAAEHSRQIASREDRAMKRRTASSVSKRLRPTIMKRTVNGSLRSTRTTTVSLQRKVARPGALKAVHKSARLNATSRRTTTVGHGRKGLPPSKRPSTPISDLDVEDGSSDEDTSPNITPASLRSASKDGRKRVFHLENGSQSSPPLSNARRSGATHPNALNKAKSIRRKPASAFQNLHDAKAGEKKSYHPAQNRPRTMRGR